MPDRTPPWVGTFLFITAVLLIAAKVGGCGPPH